MVHTLAQLWISAYALEDGSPAGEERCRLQRDRAMQQAKAAGLLSLFWDAIRDLRPAVE